MRVRGSASAPFWATVVKVELTDVVFAIDSILIAVAMSSKIWVILTGGMLGIVAMRFVIGRLLTLIEQYPQLVDGAFAIIAWVGFKLLLEFLHRQGIIHFEIPDWISLTVIVTIFVSSFLYARRQALHARCPASRQGTARPETLGEERGLAPFLQLAQGAALALVGALGGVICARKMRSIRRIWISSAVGGGVKSS